MGTDEAFREEEARLEQLKAMVDSAQAEIREGRIAQERVEDTIAALRLESERLFPGRGRTFDLIYRPRLERAARERDVGCEM